MLFAVFASSKMVDRFKLIKDGHNEIWRYKIISQQKKLTRVGGKKVGRRVHGPWEITHVHRSFGMHEIMSITIWHGDDTRNQVKHIS